MEKRAERDAAPLLRSTTPTTEAAEQGMQFTRRGLGGSMLSFATVAGTLATLPGAGLAASKSDTVKVHRIVILVSSDDEKVMGHAISYSLNISSSFALKQGGVQIEVVANGSGIRLFRADASPLLEPLAALRQSLPGIVFSMCDSSRRIAEQREAHTVDLMDGARIVPFGIGRVVELQEQGWSYIHA